MANNNLDDSNNFDDANNNSTAHPHNAGTPVASEALPDATTPKLHRKPRRDGKSGGAGNTIAKKAATAQIGTAPAAKSAVDGAAIDTVLEDEAALAEGGIKTIGNKRVIPFMRFEKPMGIFSLLMVLISLGALFINGLNLGLDFTGGVSANVTYEQPVEQEAVTQTLEKAGFNDAVVQYLGGNKELLIRLPPQSDKVSGLSERLDKALDLTGNNANIDSVSIIGSQVGNEIYVNSIVAIAISLLLMMVYVAIRFELKLAVGALLSLCHDTIVTLGIFALFKLPFDLTVLAAVLALIGYSLNDTIVVYDRIRENFRRVRGATPRQILDLALTETLRRTIMTVSTVFLVVIAMLFLGGAGLYWFSVALFIGLIAGTYSSIYIASSIPLEMGLSREDFIVKVKPEFEEEIVSFNDPKAFDYEEEEVR